MADHPPSIPPPLPRVQHVPPPRVKSGPPPLPRRGNQSHRSILTIEELDRYKNLLIFAKSKVEGYFNGKHKSPWRGSSAEFADYKEYVAGDDVARLDWRVYGRSRRLYLRQYEEETDMVVYLLVDVSASMLYAGEQRPAKYLVAARIAAALAYLMMHQGDKAALALFANTVQDFLPPGGTRRHLNEMVNRLEAVSPASTTALAQAIQDCNGLFRKRGRLVILSDFLEDNEALFSELGQFQHRGFEVLLLQVLDPDELYLPDNNTSKFVDLETGEGVQVDPVEIRAHYRNQMNELIRELARESDLRQIQYQQVNTKDPYTDSIEAYLGFRGTRSMR